MINNYDTVPYRFIKKLGAKDETLVLTMAGT